MCVGVAFKNQAPLRKILPTPLYTLSLTTIDLSITTCSQTDYTAAITGAVVVAVVFVISVTVVIVVLLLRGKQKRFVVHH